MKHRLFQAYLIFPLFNLSLFCVGFSSWVYGKIESDEINGQIKVSDVIDLVPYISEPVVTSFSVCPFGLIVDETIVYKGNIDISSSIKIKDGLANSNLNLTDTLKLYVELYSLGEFNFFSSDFMGSTTPLVQYGFSSGEITSFNETNSSLENSTLRVSLSYQDINLLDLEYLYFKIIFSFNFENYQDSFENDIYNLLDDNSLNFNLHIGVRAI